MNRNRGILIRWSKKDENHLALLQLASGVIAFKKGPRRYALLRYVLILSPSNRGRLRAPNFRSFDPTVCGRRCIVRNVAEFGGKPWARRGSWHVLAGLLAVTVIAGVLLVFVGFANATKRMSRGLPVFVVLARSRVRAHSRDPVYVLNRSDRRVLWAGDCDANISVRTSSRFTPPNHFVCPRIAWVAPRSRLLIERTIPRDTPTGKYWVWFWYAVAQRDTQHVVYTKLTIY